MRARMPVRSLGKCRASFPSSGSRKKRSRSPTPSSTTPSPQRRSRPWDAERDGFVMGEGAGVLILEEREHAIARGAQIYCEITGYGMSSDAFHITSPSEDGDGMARVMTRALKDAGLKPADI